MKVSGRKREWKRKIYMRRRKAHFIFNIVFTLHLVYIKILYFFYNLLFPLRTILLVFYRLLWERNNSYYRIYVFKQTYVFTLGNFWTIWLQFIILLSHQNPLGVKIYRLQVNIRCWENFVTCILYFSWLHNINCIK
jgi:hypothetical protein